jgi:hypothetical protein
MQAGPFRPGGPSILIWQGARDAPLATARARKDDEQLAALGAKLHVAVALALVRNLLERRAKLREGLGDCSRSVPDILKHTRRKVAEHGGASRLGRQLQGEQELFGHPRSLQRQVIEQAARAGAVGGDLRLQKVERLERALVAQTLHETDLD